MFIRFGVKTTTDSRQLHRYLETTGSINLFRFVVNPDNFAQSVENIFYLSFLIRDGKVALEFVDGEPMICMYIIEPSYTLSLKMRVADICEQPSDADYEAGLKKNQMVLEFDMTTWKVLPNFLSLNLISFCPESH